MMKELQEVGEAMSEGTEIQSVTIFKLFQSFEKVMKRMQDRLQSLSMWWQSITIRLKAKGSF